jgi:hypothetical protein
MGQHFDSLEGGVLHILLELVQPLLGAAESLSQEKGLYNNYCCFETQGLHPAMDEARNKLVKIIVMH